MQASDASSLGSCQDPRKAPEAMLWLGDSQATANTLNAYLFLLVGVPCMILT